MVTQRCGVKEAETHLRVLFSVSPGIGHLFPLIPLAWAFRAAGHDVLVATAGESVSAAIRAGLPVVETAPAAAVEAILRNAAGPEPAERVRRMRARGKQIALGGARIHPMLLETFGRLSDSLADASVAVARRWRPDLVVHSRLQGVGLLVARLLGIPAVEHGYNLQREDDLAARFLPHLADTFHRHGLPPEPPERIVLHVAPEDLLLGPGPGWPMRYVPYNAGGVLPDWIWRAAPRPRVLVTLGTVVPRLTGIGTLARLVDAAAGVDAEFVLALGSDVDATQLGRLPANIRPAGWLPLQSVLAGCAAVVHHGGSGSTMTALCAGVPQLLLPHGADQFVNATAVTRHRLGLYREPEAVDAAALEALLGDAQLREGARAAADRMAALPAPAELVDRLVAATGAGRNG
jgi:UDP:flavonoid glycosyltransferase YjiC (YdhE family)